MSKVKAEVTKVEKRASKYGGTATLVTFRDFDGGGSYHTWIASTCKNASHWQDVIAGGVGTLVENLSIKQGRLINADSKPTVVGKTNQTNQ